MIKGAIFDMDGTLLDSMCVWDRLSQTYLDRFGIEISQADYAALEGCTQYEAARYFVKQYPSIFETAQQMSEGMDAMITTRYVQQSLPREGVMALLNLLKDAKIPMAVATLTSRSHAERALKQHGILHFFRFVLTIEDVGVSKRDPKIYNIAAQRLGVPAQTCMVFEDAPYAGETAKRAGFQLCGLREPHYAQGEAELRAVSDLFVEQSFHEVLPVIEQRLYYG